MKKIIITSILSCVALVHITAQLSSQNNEAFRKHIKALEDNNVKVSIDSNNKVNDAHPYIEFFMDQDASYLAWLHTTNTINMQLHNTEDYYGPRRILRNSGGNNTLIFTLTQDGVTTYDTLRNSIHPNYVGEGKEKEDGWDIFGIRKTIAKWRSMDAIEDKNIRGDLPKGSMIYVSVNGRKEVEIGVLVVAPKSAVTIEIINNKNQVIKTLVDEGIPKGWAGYKWNRGSSPRGKYEVKVTVDGKSLSQDVKV